MNTSQTKSILRFTSNVQGFSSLPVVFAAETFASGAVMVTASNDTDAKGGWGSRLFVLVMVGVRGGLTISEADGIPHAAISR